MPLKQIVALLLTLAAAVWPWAPYFQDRENTLLKNRNWFTRERQLAKETFKTKEYFSKPQTLAGQQLNLHAWSGYQEALFRQKIQPAGMSFDFFVQSDSYVIALFDTDWGAFQGIRLSGHPDFPSAYVAGDGDGNFVHREVFETPELSTPDWHQAQLRFSGATVEVLIDGIPRAKFPVALHGARWVGFRGSAKASIVDNVALHDVATQQVYRENFSPAGLRWQAWIPSYLAGLLVMAFVLPACRVLAGSWREALAWGISLSLCVAAMGFTLLFFNAKIAGALYPAQPAFEEVAKPHIEEQTRAVGKQLAQDYVKVPEPGVLRIMFLGTSQTFGSGAGRIDSDFVSVLAQQLQEDFAGTAELEVMNAAVSGSTAEHLVNAYAASWIDFAPRLTVVNLSCNDAMYGEDIAEGDARFAKHLRQIVALNRERGIQTVFSLEALSYEDVPQELSTHIQMRKVARELGVPCVETYARMQAHRDEGLLWWDVVHPSDAGYARIAAILRPVLRDEVQKLLFP
jgi:lysophospholipase L1-like esterase